MTGQQDARQLVRVPVAPGAVGVPPVLDALAAALDGSGPAIAPIPVAGAATPHDYVMSILAAVRPDEPLESGDVALVMATSGSTGSPRGVLLTGGQAQAMTTAVQGTATPQWIVALPVTSMGGMNVLVRALATGREPVALPSLGGAAPFTPSAFAHAVGAAHAAHDDVRVSLVPAQVARLLGDDTGIDALRGCTSILVGGGPLRPSLRVAATELGITLTTTYGATETAGGCVLDGTPLPGVRVTTDAEDERAVGRLRITGPCVALGYRGGPAFTDATFVTSDMGRIGADGRLEVLGRADDVAIVNGVNVLPGAIERVLEDHPDISAAAVVVVGDDEPRIVGFVQLRDGATAPDVRSLVSARLGSVAVPRDVRFVDRLPHLPNGKVDRQHLRRSADTGAAT